MELAQIVAVASFIAVLLAVVGGLWVALRLHERAESASKGMQDSLQVHAHEMQTLRAQVAQAAQSVQAAAHKASDSPIAQRVVKLQQLVTHMAAKQGGQPQQPHAGRLLQATHRHLETMLQEQRSMAQGQVKLEVDVQQAQARVVAGEEFEKLTRERSPPVRGNASQALRQANQALMVELKELRQHTRATAAKALAAREQLDRMEAALAELPAADMALVSEAVEKVAQQHQTRAHALLQRAAQRAQEVAELNERVTRITREVTYLQAQGTGV
jgi:hypothetical protein